MDQALDIKLMLQRAHHATAERLANHHTYQMAIYIDELEKELYASERRNEHLEVTLDGLLVDYAARCREVFNLRVALRSERLDQHAERLELIEEFTASGVGSQYYHYNDSFDLTAVKLSKVPE